MAKATKAITQSDITVTRSIARETIKKIIAITGFPSDAEIIFTDEQVDSPRNIKNRFDGCYDGNGVRTKYQNFVFAEFEDQFTENGVSRHRPGTGPYPPIFIDPKLSIALEPIYAESQMSMTLRFRANDRARLSHWLNALRLRHGLVDLLMTASIRSDYSIPYRFVEFLYDSYKMREQVAGYGDTFAEYCKAHFVEGMQIRSNLNQSHNELIINEIQRHTRGWVDDANFYNAREIQAGIYEATMTYKFWYRRIIAVSLYYPPTIHNQYIPKAYADEFLHPWIREVRKAYKRPWTYAGNVLMGPDEHFIYLGDGGARTLEWDDWFPNQYDTNTQTILITPVAVDPTDPTFVFNLNDLTDQYLPKAVREFLADNRDRLYNINQRVINIDLYAVTETEERIPLIIDDQLNVRSKTELSLRARNYVRISIVKDWSRLNPVFTRELLDNADGILELLQFMDPELTITDDGDYWESIMPDVPQTDQLYRYPSLLVVTQDNRITERSYWYWLRKHIHTNDWFRHLSLNPTRRTGQYNITTRK